MCLQSVQLLTVDKFQIINFELLYFLVQDLVAVMWIQLKTRYSKTPLLLC